MGSGNGDGRKRGGSLRSLRMVGKETPGQQLHIRMVSRPQQVGRPGGLSPRRWGRDTSYKKEKQTNKANQETTPKTINSTENTQSFSKSKIMSWYIYIRLTLYPSHLLGYEDGNTEGGSNQTGGVSVSWRWDYGAVGGGIYRSEKDERGWTFLVLSSKPIKNDGSWKINRYRCVIYEPRNKTQKKPLKNRMW